MAKCLQVKKDGPNQAGVRIHRCHVEMREELGETKLEAGIRQFRLEFVHQEPEQVGGIVTAFQRFLDGHMSVAQLHQTLDKYSAQRTTQGSLFVPDNFKQLVQLQ